MNRRHPQGKYNAGPVRGETPQEGRWYEDRAQSREISRDFTGAAGMIPNNPNNFYSSKTHQSPFSHDAIAEGLTTYTSPYGDGRQFVRQEEPVLTRPGAAASLMAANEPSKDAADQPRTPGFGYGSGSKLMQIDQAQQKVPSPSTALGMSTGLSLGGGPKRNVPKPG